MGASLPLADGRRSGELFAGHRHQGHSGEPEHLNPTPKMPDGGWLVGQRCVRRRGLQRGMVWVMARRGKWRRKSFAAKGRDAKRREMIGCIERRRLHSWLDRLE